MSGIAGTRRSGDLSEGAEVTSFTFAAEREGSTPNDLVGVRVLVIMPSIPILGMERANLQIMKMLRGRGADVLFVTERTYGGKVRREVERIGCSWTTASFSMSFEERLHLTKGPLEMAGVLRAWARAAWEIDRIYGRYKPTHIYVTNLDYFLYSFPTVLRARQPVILRLPNPPGTNLLGMKRYLSDWIWRCCVRPFCDVIVCNSQYTLAELKRVGVSTRNARVIYNCLPERSSREGTDAPRVDRTRFNVAFVGQLIPEKGVKELFEVALRIVHEHCDVDFYFAGDHEWKNPFAKSLIRSVQAKNLDSRIQFIGEIEDVFGLLAQCHLHVCPSRSPGESFPNVVLEAKSRGLPSVVFLTAGIPEAVTHKVDGYICRDKSAQALYEGIRYFLDDPAALTVAGGEAKRSLERFSRERIGDQWAEVFKNV